eukprot:1042258-Pyramimonas_sp.AAC.1
MSQSHGEKGEYALPAANCAGTRAGGVLTCPDGTMQRTTSSRFLFSACPTTTARSSPCLSSTARSRPRT